MPFGFGRLRYMLNFEVSLSYKALNFKGSKAYFRSLLLGAYKACL